MILIIFFHIREPTLKICIGYLVTKEVSLVYNYKLHS